MVVRKVIFRPKYVFSDRGNKEIKTISMSDLAKLHLSEIVSLNSPGSFGRRSAFPQMPHPHSTRADADIFAPECPLELINPPATGVHNKSSPSRLPFSPEAAICRRISSRALRA